VDSYQALVENVCFLKDAALELAALRHEVAKKEIVLSCARIIENTISEKLNQTCGMDDELMELQRQVREKQAEYDALLISVELCHKMHLVMTAVNLPEPPDQDQDQFQLTADDRLGLKRSRRAQAKIDGVPITKKQRRIFR
jgi:hypothetical protein